ncbi:MAG: hypothetical protein IJ214_01070, partial [Clostridia bacterium]|nr:hypothetical protein [Clostridia bacterium]
MGEEATGAYFLGSPRKITKKAAFVGVKAAIAKRNGNAKIRSRAGSPAGFFAAMLRLSAKGTHGVMKHGLFCFYSSSVILFPQVSAYYRTRG